MLNNEKPYELNVNALNEIEIVDNQKIKEIIILLNEMYTHMVKRLGDPIFDKSQFGQWGSEGGFSISFSLVFAPFEEYGYMLAEEPRIVSASIVTELLPRADMGLNIQNFQTLDGFLNQVKNWNKFELSLPLDDKTNYFYNYNGVSTERSVIDEHNHTDSNN